VNSNRRQVRATGLDEAGCGTGLSEGQLVHVADLLPGERAEVAVDHVSPHKPEIWGKVVRRVGPASQTRVPPACPGFGRCGGCVWQHVSYPAQLEHKHARVVAALAGTVDVAAAPVRPSPALFGYRNKGKYVAGSASGTVILGAYAPRSHHVIDTLGCRVVAPVIDEVATWTRGAVENAGLVPYDEPKRAGELRYVVVREAAGETLVALIVTSETPRAKLEAVAAALAKHTAVRGVVAIANDRRDGAIVPSGISATVLHGHGYLVEELAGVKLAVGAGEFVQVNRAQAHAMYARATELVIEGRPDITPPLDGVRVVDLFAGLGGFGLHMARAGAEVVAVEIDREAVGALRRAAELARLPLTAIAADAGGITSEVQARLGEPDVVVVNPPRKGLGVATRELLAALAAPTVIYVSCGPESLGRDLAVLVERGYRADVVEPFDLMPGTAQIETLVRLRRTV
jgi:23S rRNA (uracil1939-C5)-methyltransferase